MPVPGPAGSGLSSLLVSRAGPTTREKQSLFGLIKRDIGGNVLEASYRYMTDDWGIDSHTIDVRYRWNFDGGRYLQPHVRFYRRMKPTFIAPCCSTVRRCRHLRRRTTGSASSTGSRSA